MVESRALKRARAEVAREQRSVDKVKRRLATMSLDDKAHDRVALDLIQQLAQLRAAEKALAHFEATEGQG